MSRNSKCLAPALFIFANLQKKLKKETKATANHNKSIGKQQMQLKLRPKKSKKQEENVARINKKKRCRNIPDISVNGSLSGLDAVIDCDQYKLFRGFLSFKFGEPIDD